MIYRFGIYSYRLRVVTNHGIVEGQEPSSLYFEGLAPLVPLPPPPVYINSSAAEILHDYMIYVFNLITRYVIVPITLPHFSCSNPFSHRASGNGTAGTAMAVPVQIEGEKWRRLDSNLTCVIECPLQALCRSLGRLRVL